MRTRATDINEKTKGDGREAEKSIAKRKGADKDFREEIPGKS